MAGFVRTCSSVWNIIRSVGLWRYRSPAYASHMVNSRLERPSPAKNTKGALTLSRLKPGDRFSAKVASHQQKGGAPMTASN